MPARTESKPLWDFSELLDVSNSLKSASIADVTAGAIHAPTKAPALQLSSISPVTAQHSQFPGLGDFSKIWQILGTPPPAASPLQPPESNGVHPTANGFKNKNDYASDGATYFKSKSGKGVKVVTFDDEPTSPGVETATSVTDGSDSTALTKAEKKRRKKARQKAEKAARLKKAATVSESEADTSAKKTPARKASVHTFTSESPSHRYNLRSRSTPTVPQKAEASTITLTPASIEVARERVAQAVQKRHQGDNEAVIVQKAATVAPATPHPHQAADASRLHTPEVSPSLRKVKPAKPATCQKVQQHSLQASKLYPSSVKPPQTPTAKAGDGQQPPASISRTQSAGQLRFESGSRSKPVIEPIIIRSGADRSWALLMKLLTNFYQDRDHLVAPANLTTHNNDPRGIHIFVDASNIFIGFNEQLKRARNIPSHTSMPLSNLSFDALALLMERRRPVAKRVLVGSNPHLPAFDKAKAVGYECNILDKVYKARELTERQIFFKEQEERHRKGHLNGSAKAPPALPDDHRGSAVIQSSGGRGGGTGSETTVSQFAPARMIEQGVDEILHLKILESVVDTEAPSTMVLATGDAAQAEYSKGFMAMVERALKKGWKVELVSWSANISMMYQKPQWKQTWGEQFKVVFLDDYAEELLDM
nr:hypothetical protein CFP56_01466 [Quercus suber]